MVTSRFRRLLRLAALAAGVPAVLLATACAGDPAGSSAGPRRTAVVAGFYPLAWLSEQVGGARVAVSTLTSPGSEPHDLELTPKQIVGIGEAGYVVYLRELQPAVDDAVEHYARDRSLDVASVVRTLPPPAADGGSGEDGEDEPRTSYDPHLWLDPSRMASVAATLGDRLAGVDPAGAAAFRSAAQRVAARLTALDKEFQKGLRSCRRTTMITAHAAFGYLADRYGLRQIPIAGIDPANEPAPRRLAELAGQIRAHGATTVFTETLASPKVARTLARAAGVRTAVLDPVEGPAAAGGGGDYLSLMRRNLAVLRTALGCS